MRRYLIAVSVLMVFWISVRTVKYFFNFDPVVGRYLWYLFYVPMLFIPLMMLFVSLSLGKNENFRLRRLPALLYLPTAALLLLVLTNDLHQTVFVFPDDAAVWTDKDYGYGPLFWVLSGWEYLCTLSAIGVIGAKSRAPNSRRFIWLPFVPALLLLLYSALYMANTPWIRLYISDIAVTQCVLYAATLESCIMCGLIQSNSGYDALFAASSIRAQIADENYRVRYSSEPAPDRESMERAASKAVLLDRDTLLKSHSIRGGRVFWREDVTELADVLEQLEENRKELAERAYLDKENYETRQKISSLREKNRLYDLLQRRTRAQNDVICTLIDEYDACGDAEGRRRLLQKISVVGAYVKRSGNLLFIAQQNTRIPAPELTHAVEESFGALELSGVECGLFADFGDDAFLSADEAARIYGFFETAIEAALDDLSSVMLYIMTDSDKARVRIEMESGTDMSALAQSGVAVSREDGIWVLSASVETGGAAQ